jgi:hypothetical protein
MLFTVRKPNISVCSLILFDIINVGDIFAQKAYVNVTPCVGRNVMRRAWVMRLC